MRLRSTNKGSSSKPSLIPDSTTTSTTSTPTSSSRPTTPKLDRPLHIAFIHLDLGIGGAEQLVVNAAVALQQRGHHVTLWTSHHDLSHCFAETKGKGPLAAHVRVAGDWLPRQILGRFTALCAVARMIYLAFVVGVASFFAPPAPPAAGSGGGAASSKTKKTNTKAPTDTNTHPLPSKVDVIFCDGVSAMIPFLRYLFQFPTLFYCHFPDKLLCTDRTSFWKRCYRWPLDCLEESTTGAATLIAVNSQFTSSVFTEAFPRIAPWHRERAVLYPAINLESFVPPASGKTKEEKGKGIGMGAFVSLNRFERKKNIGLALEAFAKVREELLQEQEQEKGQEKNNKKSNNKASTSNNTLPSSSSLQLIIAGGYDEANRENKDYLCELQAQAQTLHLRLNHDISFRPSISDTERATLLQDALAVLYTPDREHFGIVPLEAMYAGSPVLAVASGGPLETVVDGQTGYLCEGTGEGFAQAMMKFVRDPSRKVRMGEAGHEHVKGKFGLEAFARSLEETVVLTWRKGGGEEGGGGRGGRRGLLAMGVVVMVVVMVVGLLGVEKGWVMMKR